MKKKEFLEQVDKLITEPRATESMSPKKGQMVWDIADKKVKKVVGFQTEKSKLLYLLGGNQFPRERKEFIFPLPKGAMGGTGKHHAKKARKTDGIHRLTYGNYLSTELIAEADKIALKAGFKSRNQYIETAIEQLNKKLSTIL